MLELIFLLFSIYALNTGLQEFYFNISKDVHLSFRNTCIQYKHT
jgi:hypothetical protein